jgi:hypothetical protein
MSPGFAFTETSVESGKNRPRRGLDWHWLETRHDKNDDPRDADTFACAVLCLRDGVPPGARGHRSCAYDQCTGDLVMGRVAEPVAMGQERCA